VVDQQLTICGVAFKLPGVAHVRSSVVLKEVKAQTRLPIGVPIGAPASIPPTAAAATRRRRA